MHKPASVPENVTNKLLWKYDIQTHHLITARKPELIIIKNRKRGLTKLSTLVSWVTTE